MSFKINSLYLTDGYKVGHKAMLAPGTTKLYGTWIPRSVKHAPKGITKIVSFGQQLVWKWLHDEFEENFFMREQIDNDRNYNASYYKDKALQFVKDMSLYLGMEYDGKHFEELWDLGYLPIKVKALPEGIETDPNIPHMTFVNTVDGFAWLTLYLETLVSSLSWKPATSATIALQYKRNFVKWVMKTDPNNAWLIDYLGHDFSARGLSPWDMVSSGLGHATSFRGSDTLAVIPAARYFYGEPENEVVINSVNASEHSVSTTKIFTVGEQQMLSDWMKDFPNGILSVVSDTFDLWKLITEYLPALKEQIMSRNGKLVIRPDSGDPVDIICGTPGSKEVIVIPDSESNIKMGQSLVEQNYESWILTNYYKKGHLLYKHCGKLFRLHFKEGQFEGIEYISEAASKGVIELLWDIFGGTINKGKELLSDDEYQDKFLKLIDSDLPDFIEEGMFDEVQSGGVRSWVVRYDKYENNSSYVSKVRNWLEENYPNTFPKVERYKVLDPHIGAIYGDSITLERQEAIFKRLAAKGFASTNIVLGIGSFTYQYNTRDTFGFAAKGAWFEVKECKCFKEKIRPITEDFVCENYNDNPDEWCNNKVSYNIYKDPVTDDGTKKSLKGLQAVFQTENPHVEENGEIWVQSECTPEEENTGLLQVIYEDGKFYNQTSLTEIRKRLNDLI